jgi:pentatricopeptide repeat protein
MAQTGPRDKATIEALKERMARDPLSRAFLQLAEEYRKAGRFEEAVQVCKEGLARHPGYHTARIALGRTYLDAGDLESAHQALTEVLDTMPENHLAAKLLAEVQLRLGNRAGAAETYRAILSHYPGDREVEGLLTELGGGGGAADGPPDPHLMPTEAGELLPGASTPSVPESAAGTPPPLEVVDGGEPMTASPPADEDLTVGVAPVDEPIVAAPGPADEPGMATPGLTDEQPPSPPVSVDAQAVTGPAEGDALQTNTLAELYLRQGLVEKALEVYRAMLQVDPGNERARRRLEDLSGEGETAAGVESATAEAVIPGPTESEQSVVAEPAAPAAGEVVESPASHEPPVGDMGDPPGVSAPPLGMSGDEPDSALPPEPVTRPGAVTIDRLERWLVAIRSGSMPAGRESRR